MTRRFVDTAALRRLTKEERFRNPGGGQTVLVAVDDLDSICDELDFARAATSELAQLAGEAVGELETAVAVDVLDAERTRIRTKTLPGLLARLPGRSPAQRREGSRHVDA